MKRKRLLLWTVLLALAGAMTMTAEQSEPPAKKTATAKSSAKQSAKQAEPDEGQQVFERRCSSCHNAPEGFSPRVAGTVVRHMRVRASLSQHEEEALLRFFNP